MTTFLPSWKQADDIVQAGDVILMCRSIVLRNDLSVFSVLQHIWPTSHPLCAAVGLWRLRYRECRALSYMLHLFICFIGVSLTSLSQQKTQE